MYHWVEQSCPVCEAPPTKLVGRRGGRAHRQGFGVVCDVWRCDGCGLVFPNPMPIPVGGQTTYGVAARYFEQHEEGDQVCRFEILKQAESLIVVREDC